MNFFRLNSRTLLTAFFLSGITIALRSQAQEYPYDEKAESKAEAEKAELPKESLAPLAAAAKKKTKNVMRVGLKAGANYTSVQSVDTSSNITLSERNVGFEGALALGWDLAYQPIFLEIETGYRALLVNTPSKLSMIPLRIAAYYRERLANTSFWKIGLFGGLGLRIQKDLLGSNLYATVPLFGFSSVWEIDSFLIELSLSVHRIESRNNFVDGALRGGFRF